MISSHFFAFLFRLKLINRWPLMRNVRTENVCEHSLQVALVAHILAVIENRFFNGHFDPAHIALLAIYHDASEVLTGDLPTPIKYHNPKITEAYCQIEAIAQQKLLSLLPKALQDDFLPLLEAKKQSAAERHLLKQADILCAFLKCLEEMVAGNHEFKAAKSNVEQRLSDYRSPAVDYFITHFVPSFHLSLSELNHKERL